MEEKIEMGTVSSRGQICVPTEIRNGMGLKEGEKILFVQGGDTLIIKKVTSKMFSEITKPLKEAAKKAGIKESDVVEIVHRARKGK